MSGLISRNFINDLLGRIDIVEIISPRIRLKKSGSNYQAVCPFHQEKTPSFSVSQVKQFYYCFGCGAHGNAIDFLMQFNKLSFVEAVESLASLVGLEVVREKGGPDDQAKRALYNDFYAVTRKAAEFFYRELPKSTRAKEYLAKRGLDKVIGKRFGIGYAPNARNALANFVGNSDDTKSKLADMGVLIRGQNGRGDYYSRFRDRLIFPIRDRRGRVIAFGGRSIGDDMPKYLNSPETAIFHKGEELYGLYELREAVRKVEKILVVEGYMDVVALAKAGIDFAVASMGTAITAKQVQKLLRESSDIVFCFDGDNAGRGAAWRAVEILLPLLHEGVTVKFLFLPDKEDPDSYVKQNGKEKFLALLDDAIPFSDYFFDHLLNHNQASLDNLDGRAFVAKAALKFIDKMPPGLFRELMLQKLSQLIKMDIAKIEQVAAKTKNKTTEKNSSFVDVSSKLPKIIERILALMLQKPALAQGIKEEDIKEISSFSNGYIDLLLELINLCKDKQNLSTGAIIESYRDQDRGPLLANLAAKELLLKESALDQEFADSWQMLLKKYKERRVEVLLKKASMKELSLDDKRELQELLQLLKGGNS